MADTYYQAPVDVIANGLDTQLDTSRRWLKDPLKVGIALSAGFCVVLLATFDSLHGTSAAESTNLIGLSRSLRSPVRDAVNFVKPPVAAHPEFSSPLAKLAVTAIEANQRSNQKRDISMGAVNKKVAAMMANLDAGVQAEVEKVDEAVKMKAQDMAGVSGPFGFFDPVGFATDVEEGKLLFYREVEVKHGRVAMLAALGFLVGEQFHPLFGGNINVPSYIAFQQTPLQTFWPAVIAAIAIPEVQQIKTFKWPFGKMEEGFAIQDGYKIKSDRVPGDFGFDPLGLKPSNPAELKEMQTKELNNGRLAMIAAAGMVAQELATGRKLF